MTLNKRNKTIIVITSILGILLFALYRYNCFFNTPHIDIQIEDHVKTISKVIVSNNSLNEEKINVKVYLDKKLILEKDSLENIFSQELKIEKGVHTLSVLDSRFNIKKDMNFEVDTSRIPTYILIEYDYNPPINEAKSYYIAKMKKWGQIKNKQEEKHFSEKFNANNDYAERARSFRMTISKRRENIE